MRATLRIVVLTKEDSQYGTHSSYYTQAFRFDSSDIASIRTVTPRAGWIPRGIGKMLSIGLRTPARNQTEQTAEAEFIARMWFDRKAVGHIANIEDHLPLAHASALDRSRMVATIHFPAPHWLDADISTLRHFGKIVVLCRRDAEAFARLIPAERVTLILHGVDTTFFHCDESARSPTPQVLFVGKWLRDFNAAGEVLIQGLARWPHMGVDIVVARKWASGSVLARLADHPQVRWHDAIDDKTLRRLYQTAWILFIPLLDSSANNAIVEALACGTVPVANRVGGVVDYGGGEVFPMTATNGAADYLSLIDAYLRNPEWRMDRSRACRAFAENRLDWQFTRKRLIRVYEEMSDSAKHAIRFGPNLTKPTL
jgi:glycosyltransferase involved in cell wall biosynthesis